MVRPRGVKPKRVLVYKTSPQNRRGRAGYVSVFKDQSGCQGRFRPFAQGFKDPRATITPLGNKLVTRLFPSRQCLSTVKRPPALLACVYSRALATLHAVRKETTMKTTAVIGSTTNPIPYKGGEMSKQTLREGPMGKVVKTIGERKQTLSDNLSGKWSVPLLFTLLL